MGSGTAQALGAGDVVTDDRTYIRVHDGLDEHPKVEALSDAAFRLLHRCWYYCSRQLTDGRLTDTAWRRRGTAKARRELVDAGLVHLAGDTCSHKDCADPAPGHVQMHDYLDWQRSAAEVAEIKAARGAGGVLGNHIRWHVKRRQPDPECEFCISDRSQDRSVERSADRSQNDRSPIANGSHSHKQRQIHTENSSRGVSHVSSGSAPKPPLYSDRCQAHGDVLEPGPCGACADVRKAAQQRPPLTLVAPGKRCIVHDLTYTTVCPGCRADEIAADEEAS